VHKILKERALGYLAALFVGLGFILFSTPMLVTVLLKIVKHPITYFDITTLICLSLFIALGSLIYEVANEYKNKGEPERRNVVVCVAIFSAIVIIEYLFNIVKIPVNTPLAQIATLFMINSSTATLLIIGMILLPVATNMLLKDKNSLVGTILLIVSSCLVSMSGGLLGILFIGILVIAIGNLLNIIAGDYEIMNIISRVLKTIGYIISSIFIIILGYNISSNFSALGNIFAQASSVGGVLLIIGGILLCTSVIYVVSILFT